MQDCGKECYKYNVSSDDDELGLPIGKPNFDDGSPADPELVPKIKTEQQNRADDGVFDSYPQEISVKEEPTEDHDIITISDSDEKRESATADRSVQDVKPKMEERHEPISTKGKNIINKKPNFKGKSKIGNKNVRFDCNFPKRKTDKKKASSSIEVALQSFQTSVLEMKRKKNHFTVCFCNQQSLKNVARRGQTPMLNRSLRYYSIIQVVQSSKCF